MYTCRHCGVSKPATEFPKNRLKRNGVDSWCRECHTQANREWRERNRKPPLPPKAITPDEIKLIQLIARGYDTTELAVELGINREALKRRCRTLKLKLGVERLREIPYAYWLKTGSVPFGSNGFERRTGASLSEVVDEMFKETS